MKTRNTINSKSMRALIKEHLLSGRSITGIEAQAMWRCRSLTKRISELRKEGMNIHAEWREDSTGQRYVRYFWDDYEKVVENYPNFLKHPLNYAHETTTRLN